MNEEEVDYAQSGNGNDIILFIEKLIAKLKKL
jgi:hypothetical protein